MKKFFSRAALALLITSGLCISSSAYATEASEEWTWYADSEAVSDTEEYIGENACTEEVSVKTEAYSAYNEILGSFRMGEDGAHDYLGDYGGTYFENGNLVILRTTPSARDFDGSDDEYNGVIFRQVKYSYEELDKICDDLMDYIVNNTEYNIFYGSVDDKNNEVVIGTDEEACSSEELAEFIGDLPVRLEVGEALIPNAAAAVCCGSAIKFESVNLTSGAVAANAANASDIKNPDNCGTLYAFE